MSKLILLIEDNPSDEKLTLRAMGKSGVATDIEVVRDGAEALDYLFRTGPHAQRESRTPDLILLDLKLPRIDGLEVLRRLRSDQRTKLLPVVVLTASNEDQDVTRCYTLGANAYVRKPVDFNQFSEAARALGVFWLVLNEAPPISRAH